MSGELLNSGLALLKKATTYDAAGDVQNAITHYLLALEVRAFGCSGGFRLLTCGLLAPSRCS